MENAENDKCRLCHCHVESLTHLFSECTVPNALWNNVVSWIETKILIKLNLDKISKTRQYCKNWVLNSNYCFGLATVLAHPKLAWVDIKSGIYLFLQNWAWTRCTECTVLE